MVLGYTDEEVNRFFAKALLAIGEDWGMDELLPIRDEQNAGFTKMKHNILHSAMTNNAIYRVLA